MVVDISALVEIYHGQVLDARLKDKSKTLDEVLDDIVPIILQDKVRVTLDDRKPEDVSSPQKS